MTTEQPQHSSGMRASLLTPSYRGDLEIARDLCSSVDTFVDESIEHVLLVPRVDRDLFQPLTNKRRRLCFVEDVLPPGYISLPTPKKIEIKPFFSKKLREIWWTPTGIVRGWIMQQIVKLSANRACNGDVIIFADSDIVFVRPLTINTVVKDNAVRLYHSPGATQDSAMHRNWHRVSSKLLGIPPQDYFGADYVGNVITWRRDVLEQLQARLTEVGKRPWQDTLAKSQTFSEYILYGIFSEHILKGQNGHCVQSNDLTHPSWHYEDGGEDRFERFINDFGPNHIAVLIQSVEKLPLDERRRIIRKMTDRYNQGTLPT